MTGWFQAWLASEMKSAQLSTAALGKLLETKGVEVSGTTIRNWRTGVNLPRPAHMHVLLDLLTISEAARQKAASNYLAERAEQRSEARTEVA